MTKNAGIPPLYGNAPPPLDAPFSFGITANEIFGLAHDLQSGYTSISSEIGKVKPLLACTNKRTGFSCRMIEIQSEDQDDAVVGQIVEIETPQGFIVGSWECSASDRALDRMNRVAAEKTFVTWSALIGVRVSYGLVVFPENQIN